MLNFLKRKKPGLHEPLEARLPEQRRDGKIEINSPTWLYISGWAEEQLQAAREKNDYNKLDEVKTALLRGRIRLLKEIIKLPETESQ